MGRGKGHAARVGARQRSKTITPGVLRFDFPGYGGEGLQPVSWDDWFAAFDERRLNFLYQETKKNGQQSNFCQLETPERESA